VFHPISSAHWTKEEQKKAKEVQISCHKALLLVEKNIAENEATAALFGYLLLLTNIQPLLLNYKLTTIHTSLRL